MIIDSPFRPKYNNSGILVQGDAVIPDSDAQLNSLSFKNSSTFSGPGPYFRSRDQGSGIPSSIIINSEGEGMLADFTVTGTNFTTRPKVNGSGVLLQGEVLTTLFSGDRAIKQIPVVGVNYSGTTISGFLENLFFPYQNVITNLNDFSIYRYGIDLTNNIIYTGSYQRRDDVVTGIAHMVGSNIINGPTLVNNNDPIVNYSTNVSLISQLSASTTETYKTRIYVTRNGIPATGDSIPKRVRFEPVYFYGVSNNANLGTSIANLTNSTPSTYTYGFGSKPSNVTHAFQPNNQYIYFAYPSPDSTQEGIINWGNTLSSIFETNTNFEYVGQYSQLTPVTITFPFKSLKYRIYRSNDLITLGAGQSLNLRFTFGG